MVQVMPAVSSEWTAPPANVRSGSGKRARQPKATHHASRECLLAGTLDAVGARRARRGGVAERAPRSWAPLVSTHHYSRRARPLRLVARPESPWPYTWLKWPDFGLPLSREAAWAEIERAWRLAEVERVEVACGGGRGHTGTALAAMAILDGLEADAAVAWVRDVYDPGAVESPWQRGWLRRH